MYPKAKVKCGFTQLYTQNVAVIKLSESVPCALVFIVCIQTDQHDLITE